MPTYLLSQEKQTGGSLCAEPETHFLLPHKM